MMMILILHIQCPKISYLIANAYGNRTPRTNVSLCKKQSFYNLGPARLMGLRKLQKKMYSQLHTTQAKHKKCPYEKKDREQPDNLIPIAVQVYLRWHPPQNYVPQIEYSIAIFFAMISFHFIFSKPSYRIVIHITMKTWNEMVVQKRKKERIIARPV